MTCSTPEPREASELAAARALRDWVQRRLGIHFPDSKLGILHSRLDRLAHALGLADVEELRRKVCIEGDTALFQPLAGAVSTSHTYFFRETPVLEFLPNQILPSRAGTLADEPLRIWCAAVSSGQEAYTLGMMIVDRLGPAAAARQVSILGTDISATVIRTAEQGVYGRSAIEAIPEHYQRRFLRPRGLGQFEVVPEIRDLCTFRRLNLMADPWPFRRRFHVVVCRNVLYYFEPRNQALVAERLYDTCEPGGWLLTSTTEAVRGLATRWKPVEPGVYRRDPAYASPTPLRVVRSPEEAAP